MRILPKMKNNKLTKNILAVLLGIMAVFPMAMAANHSVNVSENESEMSVEAGDNVSVKVSEKEANVMSNPLGAKIRLTQLEHRVSAQYEASIIVLDKVNNTNISEKDYNRLENISTNFGAILDEINSTDFNKSASELASEFVALKEQAINNTQKFRNIVRAEMTPEQRRELKHIVESYIQNSVEKKKNETEELINKFNSEKLNGILASAGVSKKKREMIMSKVESGELSVEEAKKNISSTIKSLPPQAKKERLKNMSEIAKKNKAMAKNMSQKIEMEAKEKKQEIMQRVEEKRKEITKMKKERMAKIREKVMKNIPEHVSQHVNIGGVNIKEKKGSMNVTTDDMNETVKIDTNESSVEVGSGKAKKVDVDY